MSYSYENWEGKNLTLTPEKGHPPFIIEKGVYFACMDHLGSIQLEVAYPLAATTREQRRLGGKESTCIAKEHPINP